MTSADCFRIDPILLAGSSNIGRNHVALGLPNQDAIYYAQHHYGNVLVVADGVGSEAKSELASTSVTQAVDNVFFNLYEHVITCDDIAEALCSEFRKALSAICSTPTSTTCIFCVHLTSGELYIGQIGDGICCGSINESPFTFIQKDSPFANVVEPLSPYTPAEQWNIMHFSHVFSVKLLLATDGIADDILPGKETDFAHYLINSIESYNVDDREKQLHDILANWETPQSNDDKTIGLYHYSVVPEE